MKCSKKAFGKYVSSVFVIGSPFQALCAIEAIREFEISDYKVILPLSPNEQRNRQLLTILKDFGIVYEIFNAKEARAMQILLNECKIKHKKDRNRYNRAFIGDYYQILYKSIALSYLNTGSPMVYLDDGNSSISIFRGVRKKTAWRSQCVNLLFYSLARIQKIIPDRFFYTIYYDIDERKFFKYPNHFSYLFFHKEKDTERASGVIFIGTNTSAFCEQMGIQESMLENIISKLFMEIHKEYPSQEITYVPHGRDSNIHIPDICAQNNVVYRPIEVSIEYFLYKEQLFPVAIYGFSSTALFNLKKMMPNIRAVNYVIEKMNAPYYEYFNRISEYYQQNSIKRESIKLL